MSHRRILSHPATLGQSPGIPVAGSFIRRQVLVTLLITCHFAPATFTPRATHLSMRSPNTPAEVSGGPDGGCPGGQTVVRVPGQRTNSFGSLALARNLPFAYACLLLGRYTRARA